MVIYKVIANYIINGETIETLTCLVNSDTNEVCSFNSFYQKKNFSCLDELKLAAKNLGAEIVIVSDEKLPLLSDKGTIMLVNRLKKVKAKLKFDENYGYSYTGIESGGNYGNIDFFPAFCSFWMVCNPENKLKVF